MVCYQSTSNTPEEPASATHSAAASAQQASVMHATADLELDEQPARAELDEEPARAGCFSWVHCCCRRLWRRLKKRTRSRRLRVSLPHGETGAQQHDGAAPPPLAANTEMEEEGQCSEGAGNTNTSTAVIDTTTPVLCSAQQNFKPVVEDLNTIMSTSARTGRISIIIVRVAWKTNFACTTKHDVSGNIMLLNNIRTLSNTSKTKLKAFEEQHKNIMDLIPGTTREIAN